jgi:hypothetical protein
MKYKLKITGTSEFMRRMDDRRQDAVFPSLDAASHVANYHNGLPAGPRYEVVQAA